jgi:hypothetical protein
MVSFAVQMRDAPFSSSPLPLPSPSSLSTLSSCISTATPSTFAKTSGVPVTTTSAAAVDTVLSRSMPFAISEQPAKVPEMTMKYTKYSMVAGVNNFFDLAGFPLTRSVRRHAVRSTFTISLCELTHLHISNITISVDPLDS